MCHIRRGGVKLAARGRDISGWEQGEEEKGNKREMRKSGLGDEYTKQGKVVIGVKCTPIEN